MTFLGKRHSELALTDLEAKFWVEIGQRMKALVEAKDFVASNAKTINDMLAEKNLTIRHLEPEDPISSNGDNTSRTDEKE